MEYTSNYHLSKPEGDDIINPTSRTGYNGNFDTLDTTLKSVSNKANTNESNITTLQGDVADLEAKTGDDIPFESGSQDSISDKITNLDNSVGNKPSGETDTLWDKIGILSNPIVESNYNNVFSSIPSNITISGFNLIKLGKIVMLNFTSVFDENLPASAWHELATLNSNYKPYSLFETFVINNANDTAIHARYEANGQIRVYLTSSARAFKVSNIYIISGT